MDGESKRFRQQYVCARSSEHFRCRLKLRLLFQVFGVGDACVILPLLTIPSNFCSSSLFLHPPFVVVAQSCHHFVLFPSLSLLSLCVVLVRLLFVL